MGYINTQKIYIGLFEFFFKDTSTLVGHFVLSLREKREKEQKS